MDVNPCSLDELSRARAAFGTCPLPSVPHCNALVVQFHGEAANDREHFGTFAWMRAMIAAGIAVWSPEAVVLDLRGLIYEWGDNMVEVLTCGDRLPVAVVVSALNLEGLTSLVEREVFARPGDWLYESVDEAVSAVDRLATSLRGV